VKDSCLCCLEYSPLPCPGAELPSLFADDGALELPFLRSLGGVRSSLHGPPVRLRGSFTKVAQLIRTSRSAPGRTTFTSHRDARKRPLRRVVAQRALLRPGDAPQLFPGTSWRAGEYQVAARKLQSIAQAAGPPATAEWSRRVIPPTARERCAHRSSWPARAGLGALSPA